MMSDNSDTAIAKVVDFGLSKMLGSHEKTDEPFGTLGYAAPEILLKNPYSFECDIWSFGCIIYAMFTGCLPFDSDKSEEVVKMTLKDSVKFNDDCWNHCSESIIDLLHRML